MSAEAAATPANPVKPSRWIMLPWLAEWAMPAVLVAVVGLLIALLMVVLMEFHSLHVEIQDSRTESLAAIERQSARIDETNVRIDQTNASVRETNVRIDGLYERLPPPG